MTSQKALYHMLIAGEVIFHDEEGNTGRIPVNALVTGEDHKITAHRLGQAQQALQLQFFKKAADATATVVDVFIISISHLGLMTDEEFKAVPEGLQLQPKASAVN